MLEESARPSPSVIVQPFPRVRRNVYTPESLLLLRKSLSRRAACEPCPKRLLSQMITAFLATRSISLTTAFGFTAWCKVANSQTTSKLASANGRASPVAQIIETYDVLPSLTACSTRAATDSTPHRNR